MRDLMTIAFDYLRVGVRHPKLLAIAIEHVLRIRFRFLYGGVRSRINVPTISVREAPSSPATIAAQLAERLGVILLRDAPRTCRLGVRDIDISIVLAELRRIYPTGDLYVIDASNGGRSLRDASLIGFSLPGGQQVEIETYQYRTKGVWLSQNRNNRDLRALYDDILDYPGLHNLSQILPAPTLEQHIQRSEIDVVCTWVNHLDPHWLKNFDRYRERPRPPSDAAALSRFHSSDELRYSLRSIHENLPWVRNIHILTNCARPDWLVAHDQIHWVDHERIIPHKYLPTFSSHVIESYLHHIPDLTRRFVYMNDDFFVAKPQGKEFFFAETGHSRVFLEDDGIVLGAVRPDDPEHLNASRNSARLLQEAFGFWPTRLHKHSPYALNSEILTEIECRWSTEFENFREQRFRSSLDLNLTSFLYHHYALMTGRAEIADARVSLISSHDVRWRNRLRSAAVGQYEVICINEGGVDPIGMDWYGGIRNFLKGHFPRPAPWENDRLSD